MRLIRLITISASFFTGGIAISQSGCGPTTNPDIVYKKLTPEEFDALPPEEQETPEVQENMGAAWKDPNLPENAKNPKKGRRRR